MTSTKTTTSPTSPSTYVTQTNCATTISNKIKDLRVKFYDKHAKQD